MPSFQNRTKQWVPLIIAGLVLAYAWSMVGAQDKAKKPAAGTTEPNPTKASPARAEEDKPYGDKVISVMTKGNMGSTGYNLHDVKLSVRAGKTFLTGTGVDDGSWTRGLQVEVAWDEVSSVLVFENLEQFNERVREAAQEGAAALGNLGIFGGAGGVIPALPEAVE